MGMTKTGFKNYKPKERSVKAFRYSGDYSQLESALGKHFVKTEVSPRDPLDASTHVFNVATKNWHMILPGQYVVVGPGQEYVVTNGNEFEEKYEEYVTRDQGFTPRMPDPWHVIGKTESAGPGVNKGTHVDSPRVGGRRDRGCFS